MRLFLARFIRSLQGRLLLSYVVVLLLTLSVISVALVLLVQSRPLIVNTAAFNNLATQLNTFLGTLDNEAVVIGDLPIVTQAQLRNVATRLNVRIMLYKADGSVTFDSTRAISKGDKIKLNAQPFRWNSGVTPQVEPFVNGTGRTSRGVEFLFVGQTQQASDNPERQYLLFAVGAQRMTAEQISRFYGPEVLSPLFQAGFIGIIAAALLSAVISRSVAKPLKEVAEAAEALAQGKRQAKAPIRGPQEVRQLAESFNLMVEEMQDGRQAQRDFLANVSHDLRTPLTSIQGYSQAIIDGVAKPERAADIIHSEAARMYRMVEELLDLARIEAGKLNMARHGVKIAELLSALGDQLSMVARNKGIHLATQIAPDLPVIAGDGDRLSQVFQNLIDNSLKHTQLGGIVTLRAEQKDNGVLVTVHDTGEGIPAADLPRIFERFYQVDKSRQRRDGAGLGLQICYQIIQAHGGRIWVESEEGQWTKFSVWLPLPAIDSSTIYKRRSEVLRRTPN